MSNIWIVIVVLVLLAFLSARTFHITLKRRFDKISVEVDSKLLALFPRKTRVFDNVIGAYMKSVRNREGFEKQRVILNAGTRRELLDGEDLIEKRAFEITEQINDFIDNSGVSEKVIRITQGKSARSFLIMVALFLLVMNGVGEMRATQKAKDETMSNPSSKHREVVLAKKKELTDMPDFPAGSMKPEFCRFTEIQSGFVEGAYSLWGELDVPIIHAGNMVNAFMRNTSWEPDGVIKQSDAAFLSYTNGEYHLSYLFLLLKKSGKNTCIISWEPVKK